MGFSYGWTHEISRTDSKGNTIDISQDEEETNYDVNGSDPEEPTIEEPNLDGDTDYNTDGVDDTEGEDEGEEPDLDGDTDYNTDGVDNPDEDDTQEGDNEGEEPDLDSDTDYNTDEADNPNEGEDDTQEGDNEGEEPDLDGDTNDNLGSADDNTEEGEVDPSKRLKDLEKQISKLSEEQLKIRDKTLITNFIDLFKLCGSINKRLNSICRTPDTDHDIQFAIDQTNTLKKTIFAYISNTYRTKTYSENLSMYSECIMTLHLIDGILKKNIKKKKEK